MRYNKNVASSVNVGFTDRCSSGGMATRFNEYLLIFLRILFYNNDDRAIGFEIKYFTIIIPSECIMDDCKVLSSQHILFLLEPDDKKGFAL